MNTCLSPFRNITQMIKSTPLQIVWKIYSHLINWLTKASSARICRRHPVGESKTLLIAKICKLIETEKAHAPHSIPNGTITIFRISDTLKGFKIIQKFTSHYSLLRNRRGTGNIYYESNSKTQN